MKKFFLILSVVSSIFLFGCSNLNHTTAKATNNSSVDLRIYYSLDKDTIYDLPSNSSLELDVELGGGINAIDMPESVEKTSSGYDVTFSNKKVYTITVYNKFYYPILFYYDDNSTIIKSGESFTYKSYYQNYSFKYIVSDDDGDYSTLADQKYTSGNNDDLTVEIK